jgi:hypothetical protein
MTQGKVGVAIAWTTEMVLGARLRPHDYHRCATTAAFHAGGMPYLASSGASVAFARSMAEANVGPSCPDALPTDQSIALSVVSLRLARHRAKAALQLP